MTSPGVTVAADRPGWVTASAVSLSVGIAIVVIQPLAAYIPGSTPVRDPAQIANQWLSLGVFVVLTASVIRLYGRGYALARVALVGLVIFMGVTRLLDLIVLVDVVQQPRVSSQVERQATLLITLTVFLMAACAAAAMFLFLTPVNRYFRACEHNRQLGKVAPESVPQRLVNVAALLYWAAIAVVGIQLAVAALGSLPSSPQTLSRWMRFGEYEEFVLAFGALCFLPVFAFVVFRLRLGWQWARVTLTVLSGIVCLIRVLTLLDGSPGVVHVVLTIVQIAIFAVALVYSYRPALNAYFRP